MAAAEHVYELVLDQAAGNGRVVLEYEQRIDRTGEAHLLREAPAGGVGGAFARQRMAAAGVGPQAAGVIFRQAPPLQQEFALSVAHQHRDGAVLQAAPVRVELAGGADLDIVGIDQNDRVVVGGTGHPYDLPPSLSLRVFHTTWPARDVAEIGLMAVTAAALAGSASCFFRLLANWFISAVAVAWIMPTPRPYCATAPDSVRLVCTSTLEPVAEGSSRNVAAAWAEPRPLASVPWARMRAV